METVSCYNCGASDSVGYATENGFDLRSMWEGDRRKELREDVAEERCSHCWTPCEAYPTILGNLGRAAASVATTPRIVPVGTT